MMTIVRSLVLGVFGLAMCTLMACEKQPYSKIKSIEETIFHHGHGDDHGKDGHDKHDKAADHGKKEENAGH